MGHAFFSLRLIASTAFGCLIFGTVLIPLHSTAVNSQVFVAQQSNQRSDARTIAEQVRQDAITRDRLEKTARVVKIERIGKEIWMYNPVPYWKITIADSRERLVYFTNDRGTFRILMQRNGQAVHAPGKPAQAVPPPEMVNAVLRQAKAWGYPDPLSPTNLSVKRTTWASGCENISAPFACDPIQQKGWEIKIPYQGGSWTFRGETVEDLQLIERSNLNLERRLPTQVRNEVKRIAGNHLRLSPAMVFITNIELLTFSDSCLGLGGIAESCAQQMVRGYRVTVASHPTEQQIYRISNDASLRRTEAIAGLPVRTDELPTTVALKIFNAAQTDLKQPIANLSITQVENTFNCFRNPTAAPNEPCIPIKSINGWQVTVTNPQKLLTYTVDLDGKVLSKQ